MGLKAKKPPLVLYMEQTKPVKPHLERKRAHLLKCSVSAFRSLDKMQYYIERTQMIILYFIYLRNKVTPTHVAHVKQ